MSVTTFLPPRIFGFLGMFGFEHGETYLVCFQNTFCVKASPAPEDVECEREAICQRCSLDANPSVNILHSLGSSILSYRNIFAGLRVRVLKYK
jgi:hypothetical protein